MNQSNKIKKQLKNKWVLSIAGVVFLVSVVLVLLPIVGKFYLTKWLLDNGADTAVIEKVWINPFTGKASLKGLKVSLGDATVLSDSDMRVDIGLMSLLNKQMDIKETVLQGFTIDIELYEDGRMRFGSYSINPTTGEAQTESDNTAISWIILARQVTLLNCRVHFKMPDLDITLQVDDALLKKFSTAAGELSGVFTLNGSVNGTPVAFDFNTLRVLPDVIVRGTVKIDGFELDNLSDLLGPYLKPFTGQASVDGTVAFELADSGDLFVDYDGMISLENGHIAGESFSVQGASVRWEKGKIHYEDTEEKGIVINVDGTLTGHKLALDLDDLLEYKQETLAARGKCEVRLASQINVNYNGILDFKESNLQMAVVTSTVGNMSWHGSGDFTLTADNSMNLALDDALKSNSIEVKLVESGLLFGQQSLETTTNASVDTGQGIAIKGTSSLASDGFSLTDSTAKTSLLSVDSFAIDTIQASGGKTISIKKAEAKGLNVGIEGNMPLKVTVPAIVLADSWTEDLATFNTTKVTVRSPVVVATKNNKKLAGLGILEIRNVKAGLDQHVTADRVNFDDLFFLGKSVKEKDNICSIGVANLSKIGWSPEEGMKGESLSFTDLYCTLIRGKDGSFVISKELAAMIEHGPDKEKAGQKTEEKEPGATLHLGQVTLRGESGLHFEDHTLELPTISDLAITTLQIENINSAKPAEPATLRLVGMLDKRAPLTISGTIVPFAKDFSTTMKVNLKNLPLAHLSAYTVQSVGVALASGQLKIKSDIQLSDNTLDMKNEILLRKLETGTVSKELADKLDNQLPIPLDSALSILRDKDDNISLNVPINGPLDELDVGISDILITALGKAVVPAASGYLMYTLGPYGALLWIGKEVGERMLRIRLPPVEFAPKESKIPESLQDYFERLAKILEDKPDAGFQLSPISSAWEFVSESQRKKLDGKELELSDRDREELMQLGQRRAQSIKDYLIQNYAIDKDRLLISLTLIETEKSVTPRVDIQM